MPPAAARALSPVARLWRDRRGLAAVEFALVLPILLLFAVGVTEVSRYALLGMKLQHAADAMADLASRDQELSAAGLQGLFAAVPHIVEPFDVADQGVVIVSAVGVDSGGPPTVFWQRSGAGSLGSKSAIGTAGGRATLPKTLVVRDGDTVIVAEIYFRYESWLLQLVPRTTLRRVAFYRPRLGTLRTLT
jgi:Flp pilus assembly protein TadG